MRYVTISLLSAALAVGCNGDRPTDPVSEAPRLMMSGTSGCYTVTGRIVQSGVFPNFSGTISGDIEGNVVTTLDPASVSFRGPTQHIEGEQTWEVTGGNVDGLTQVTLTLNGVSVIVQPPTFRNNVTARVVDGAAKGNLTYHGFIDVSDAPPVAVDVEYHGVICP